MATKRYPNGLTKQLTSLRQVERNLWKVSYIKAYSTGDRWLVAFHCHDGLVFLTPFQTREEVWTWVHRPVLNGAILMWVPTKTSYVIDHKNRENYPWHSA